MSTKTSTSASDFPFRYSLKRLLQPRSIAAVGGRAAQQVLRQCKAMGYTGDLFPVHPSKRQVCGLKCYPSLESLPHPPDAAFLGVNNLLSVDLLSRLSRMGAGGAVCYASGFLEAQKEIEHGEQLHKELLHAAGAMPFIGPNCYGFVNCLDAVPLWPDQHAGKFCRRGVALLAQSSNIAMNMSMQRRALPLAFFASLGNQAQIGMLDLAYDLLADKRVSAIGMIVEGIDDVEKLACLARAAYEVRTPILMLKIGKTPQGREAALSHSASISGGYDIARAAFRKLGIGQVSSLPALIEGLKLLHTFGPLPSARLASMSCSGGEAALIADHAHQRVHAHFPPLSSQQQQAVKATLSEMVAVANPLDYHTFVWTKRKEMTRTFRQMLDYEFDLTFLILDFPHESCSDADWKPTALAIEDAAKASGARVAVVSSLPENMPERWAQRFLKRGIATIAGFTEAMEIVDASAEIGAAWQRGIAKTTPFLLARTSGKARLIEEADAKQLLSHFSVPVPEGRVVSSSAEALEVARELAQQGRAVVLKALGLAHKSEAGGLAINLSTPSEIERHFARLREISSRVLVEAFVEGGLCEVLVGITRDAQFGLTLTLSAGGVWVELMREKAVLPLPVSRREVEAALRALPIAALLDGFRGKPKADSAALIALILSVSRFAERFGSLLCELDLNPVVVRAEGSEGQGAVALDALLRLYGREQDVRQRLESATATPMPTPTPTATAKIRSAR